MVVSPKSGTPSFHGKVLEYVKLVEEPPTDEDGKPKQYIVQSSGNELGQYTVGELSRPVNAEMTEFKKEMRQAFQELFESMNYLADLSESHRRDTTAQLTVIYQALSKLNETDD